MDKQQLQNIVDKLSERDKLVLKDTAHRLIYPDEDPSIQKLLSLGILEKFGFIYSTPMARSFTPFGVLLLDYMEEKEKEHNKLEEKKCPIQELLDEWDGLSNGSRRWLVCRPYRVCIIDNPQPFVPVKEWERQLSEIEPLQKKNLVDISCDLTQKGRLMLDLVRIKQEIIGD